MRFLAAWLGLHALLLQLLLPVLHHPEHVYASRRALAEGFLALADIGAPPMAHHSDRDGDPKRAPPCPLCLSIQHAQTFLPPAAPVLLLPAARPTPVRLAAPDDEAGWINLAARARAPPLAA